MTEDYTYMYLRMYIDSMVPSESIPMRTKKLTKRTGQCAYDNFMGTNMRYVLPGFADFESLLHSSTPPPPTT